MTEAPQNADSVIIDCNQLQVAFDHPSTMAFAYYGVAKRLRYSDGYNIQHWEQVRVYGSRFKTVAICWKEGYRDRQTILCMAKPDAAGFEQALKAISDYFDPKVAYVHRRKVSNCAC